MTQQRITESFLEAVCLRINRAIGMPHAPYEKKGDRHVAQIGNYHISHAYGGVCLHRMHNAGGGVSDVFGCGHVTKRELADRMFAFLKGVEAGCEMMAQTEAA